jgi:hypothetical protein
LQISTKKNCRLVSIKSSQQDYVRILKKRAANEKLSRIKFTTKNFQIIL